MGDASRMALGWLWGSQIAVKKSWFFVKFDEKFDNSINSFQRNTGNKKFSEKLAKFGDVLAKQEIGRLRQKYDLIDDTANIDSESDPFDTEMFQAVLNSVASIREATHHQASLNIKEAQAKQQKDFINWHRTPEAALPVGSKVLLENQKRKDRKGGKFTYKWMGPYTVKSISKSGL